MSATSLRALVVDDSPAMRRHLVQALAALPSLACAEAEDGLDGLKQLAAGRFDLLLTDIHMPKLDGLKLVAAVRGKPALARLPIVVITTLSAEVDRQRALSLGADVYLVKPVDPAQVVDVVRRLLAAAC